MTLFADADATNWTLVVSGAINGVLTLAAGYFAMRANLAKIAAEAEPAKLRAEVGHLTSSLVDTKARLAKTESYADECIKDRQTLREEMETTKAGLTAKIKDLTRTLEAAAGRERGRHPHDGRIPDPLPPGSGPHAPPGDDTDEYAPAGD